MRHFIHHSNKASSAGEPILGAVIKGGGVNFGVYSRQAKDIFLLLFERPNIGPSDTIQIKDKTGDLWHVFVEGLQAGQLYGYRVDGEYTPSKGYRFNPYKVLVDPYAKAVVPGNWMNDEPLHAYELRSRAKDLTIDRTDNAQDAYKSIVVEDDFNWGGDKCPNISLKDLIIYETHLKGFTAHKSAGVHLPGTYLGFIEKIPHLLELGINAVEFLPIHAFHQRSNLLAHGLSEYWGYNTISFFAPEFSYSTRRDFLSPVREFKTLVKELHRAGIEVILDVVYNHTAEGDETGPTIFLKGFDNTSYYRLRGTAHDPLRYYVNDSGCGNTINAGNEMCLRMIIDSLRYWVEIMHVDGFRFDLASVLGREKEIFLPGARFFELLKRDPVLENIKLIAEPWDLAGCEIGNFPRDFSEWNGKFRDTARRFIKGDHGQMGDFATRLSGSSDLYRHHDGSPLNSINFVTCHDGFTLNDLFSYNKKHNLANGEHNADGANENFSFNCGAEGNTDKRDILRLRRRLAKNALACLMLSAGVPMINGGDEFLRTQKGNNNPYCQDNELSWFDWGLIEENVEIFDFTRKLIAFRKKHLSLRRNTFFSGIDENTGNFDIRWFNEKLTTPDWNDYKSSLLCCELDCGDYFLFFIFNAHAEKKAITLPVRKKFYWRRVMDTGVAHSDSFFDSANEPVLTENNYSIRPMSIAILEGITI